MIWHCIDKTPPPMDGTAVMLWHVIHQCGVCATWQDAEFAGYSRMWFEVTRTTCWPYDAFTHWAHITPPEDGE